MTKSTKMLLLMANAFCYVCYMSIAYLHFTYYSAMQESLNLTNTEMGIIGMGVGSASVVSYFVGGPISDIFSAKKILIFGHIAAAGCLLYFATMPSFIMVFFLMMVGAFLNNALLWNASAKMVREFSTSENEAKMYGYYLSFTGLGGTIFGLTGAYYIGQMGSTIGLQIVFYLLAAYLVIATIVTFTLYKKPTEDSVKTAESEVFKLAYILEIMKNLKFWILSAAGSMLYCIGLAMTYFSPLLHDNYGVSMGLVSTVGIFRFYLGRLVCAPIGGILVQKTNSLFIMKCALATACICVATVAIMPMSSAMLIPSVIIILILAIAYNTSSPTWYTPLTDIGIPDKMKGTAIGLFGSILFHSDLYMYLMCGVILDTYEPQTAYRAIFAMLTGIFMTSFILLVILARMLKKEKMKAALASVAV